MTDKKKGLTPKEQDYEAMVADIQPTFQSQEPQQVVCPDCGGCGGVDVEIDGEIEAVGCALCGATGKVQPETPDELLTALQITNLVNGYNSVDHSPCGVSVFEYIAKAQLSKVHQSEATIRAEYEKKIKKLELKIKESTEFKDKAFLYMNQVAIPRAEEEAIADERKKIVSIVLSHVEAESGLPPRWVAELIFKLMRC